MVADGPESCARNGTAWPGSFASSASLIWSTSSRCVKSCTASRLNFGGVEQGLTLCRTTAVWPYLCGKDAVAGLKRPAAAGLQLLERLSRAVAAADVCQHAREHRVGLSTEAVKTDR